MYLVSVDPTDRSVVIEHWISYWSGPVGRKPFFHQEGSIASDRRMNLAQFRFSLLEFRVFFCFFLIYFVCLLSGKPVRQKFRPYIQFFFNQYHRKAAVKIEELCLTWQIWWLVQVLIISEVQNLVFTWIAIWIFFC